MGLSARSQESEASGDAVRHLVAWGAGLFCFLGIFANITYAEPNGIHNAWYYAMGMYMAFPWTVCQIVLSNSLVPWPSLVMDGRVKNEQRPLFSFHISHRGANSVFH